MTYKGPISGRPNDTVGIAVAYARISSGVRGFDRDARAFNPDAFQPIRSNETVIEVTYQAEIVPGWTVQPDFQYAFRPGGGVANPRSAGPVRVKDAAVFGLRSSIRY